MATDKLYNQKIRRIVNNFNRKVGRLEKAGYDLLPSKVSVREIKRRYDNRTAMNAFLRDLQRFSVRGAENIVTVGGKDFTAYDVDIFKRRLRRERYRLNKDIIQAQSYKTKYPMQHDVFLTNLKAKRATLSGSWFDLITSKIAKNLDEQQARYAETYENYFSVLFEDAYQMEFDDEKLDYIKNQLMRLSPRDFIRAIEDDPNIQAVFDYYHSLTRTSDPLDDNSGVAKFNQLYKNIDEIVARYKWHM